MVGGRLIAPELIDGQDEHAWRETYQFYGLLTGQPQWGAPVSLTDLLTAGGGAAVEGDLSVTGNVTLGDAAANTLVVRATSSFQAPASFAAHVTLGDAAADALTVNATATFQAPASFHGNVTLGDAAADALAVNATATFNAPLTATANVTLGDAAADALTVVATSTFQSPATFGSTTTFAGVATFNSTLRVVSTADVDSLNVRGNATLGDAAADALLVNATSVFQSNLTVRNVAGTLFPLYVEASSGRVLVGTTALPGGTFNGIFQVVGARSWFHANNEPYAMALRFGTTHASQVYLGASNAATPDLIVSNNAGNQIGRITNLGAMIVGGAGAAAPFGSEMLRVDGPIYVNGTTASTITGGVSVTGGVTLNDATVMVLASPAVVAAGARTLDGYYRITVVGTTRWVPYYL
jgi:hypothetical protein